MRTPQGPASDHAPGTERIRSVVDPTRPTLRLIHREGDPRGVLAVAVFSAGGSRGALLLGHLMAHRLNASRRWTVERQIHGIGFVLAAEVRSVDDGAEFLEALRAVLVLPVEPAEIAAAKLPGHLEDAARPGSSPSLTASCGAELAAEGARGLDAGRSPTGVELEELRKASVRSGRIGLSALGHPALLDRVAQQHRAKWPVGGPPPDDWPADSQVAVRKSSGVFELEVASRVLDQGRALAAGRALRRADHPAFTRLRAIDTHLAAGPVSVALRPLGACLSVALVRESPLAPTVDAIVAATLVLEQEMLQALRDAPLDESALLALLAPESALEAASLAAWTAVSAPAQATPARTLVEVVVPETTALTTNELAGLLRTTEAAWEKRGIPVVSQSESGQPESWLLVGSPCGTGPEPGPEAGLRALAVESAARAFDGSLSVELEPWVEAKSIGLLAHSAPLRGESPEQLAERLARVAVQALALGDVDGRAIAAARSAQLALVGSDPGSDLLLRTLSGDRPSLLDPRGLEREVAALSTLDVQRARYALSREPLRAAYLASARASEADAAEDELTHLLAPHRSDVLPCPSSGQAPEGPGSWTVTSVDTRVLPGAFVGAVVNATGTSGVALEFLLNRPGGYLERGLIAPGLAETARARFLPGAFGSALVVEVRAPKRDLERALAQLRGILASLAERVPEADVRLARDEDARQRSAAERGPRGRIVELWLGRLPAAPTAADLRSLAEQLRPDQHRVVRVDVRAE